MIEVESLTIFEFRGIKELTLPLNRKDFSVCGPTGTGKMDVVDALEFVLAGGVDPVCGQRPMQVLVLLESTARRDWAIL